MKPGSASSARFGPWKLLGAFILCALLVRAMFHFYAVDEEARRRQEALQYLEFTARIAAQGISHQVVELDECFELLFSLATASTSGAEPNREVVRRLADLVGVESRGVVEVALIAPNGATVFSEPASAAVQGSNADQLVERHRGAGAVLAASEPTFIRDTGRWTLRFSRRLALPDGTYLGVGVVTVAVDRLARQMAAYVWRDGHTVSLFRDDGLMLATTANINPRMLGFGIRTTRRPQFGGFYAGEDSSPITGDARLMHLRIIPETRLFLAVSEPLDAHGETDAFLVGSTHLIEGAIIVIFGATFLFLYEHQRRTNDEREKFQRQRHEDGLRGMFDGRDEMFVIGTIHSSGIFDEEFRSIPAITTAFGEIAEEDRSKGFLETLDPKLTLQELAGIHGELLQGRKYATTRRFVGSGGREFLLQLSFSALDVAESGIRFFAIVEGTEGSSIADAARSRVRMAAASGLAAELIRDFVQKMTVVALAAENSLRKLESPGEDGTGFAIKRLADIARIATDMRDETSRIRTVLQEQATGVEQMALPAVLAQAVFLSDAALAKAGVVVTDRTDNSLPPIIANRLLLEFVLFTLIARACRRIVKTPGVRADIRSDARIDETTGMVVLQLEYRAYSYGAEQPGRALSVPEPGQSHEMGMIEVLVRSMWARLNIVADGEYERISIFLRSDR